MWKVCFEDVFGTLLSLDGSWSQLLLFVGCKQEIQRVVVVRVCVHVRVPDSRIDALTGEMLHQRGSDMIDDSNDVEEDHIGGQMLLYCFSLCLCSSEKPFLSESSAELLE